MTDEEKAKVQFGVFVSGKTIGERTVPRRLTTEMMDYDDAYGWCRIWNQTNRKKRAGMPSAYVALWNLP